MRKKFTYGEGSFTKDEFNGYIATLVPTGVYTL